MLFHLLLVNILRDHRALTPRGVARYTSGANASHWAVYQPMSRLLFSLHVEWRGALAAAAGRLEEQWTALPI